MTSEEKYTIDPSQLVEKVKQLIAEGNVRRIRIIHKGQPLIDIPLTIGAPVAVATILLAPVLAAVGALAALITECTIEVEKVAKKTEETEGKRPEQSA